ncbi:MAG: MBL fold metallo-hydrolase [Clostridia bacterium]|nr:MBL fold metallo-hydrolase [Clostridia bacterium]
MDVELKRLTERVWYYPYEQERDRPNLGYIRGDKWSLAVDAGHSDAHVAEFYRALERENLPLPALTVLTHWHWDHTCGLHSIKGLSIASAATNQHLRDFRQRIAREGREAFLSIHESVRLEYAGGQEIRIQPADMEFEGSLLLDAGNCPVRLIRTEAPHTDDSTLVHVMGENVLFLGDASCGVFPTWEKDGALCEKLAETLKSIGPDVCLEGHWTPTSLWDTLEDLLK